MIYKRPNFISRKKTVKASNGWLEWFFLQEIYLRFFFGKTNERDCI